MKKSRNSTKEKPMLCECIWKTCCNLYFEEKEPYWGRCAAILLEMLIGYTVLQRETESIPDIVLSNLNSERFNENLQDILNSTQECQVGHDDQLQNISMMVMNDAKPFLHMTTSVQAWQLNKIREVSSNAIRNSRNAEAINSLLKTITEYMTATDTSLGTDPNDVEVAE